MTGHGTNTLNDSLPSSYIGDVSIHTLCHVSAEDDARHAVICDSLQSAHSSQELSPHLEKLLGLRWTPLRMNSQVKYGRMARRDAMNFLPLPRKGYADNICDVASASIVIGDR